MHCVVVKSSGHFRGRFAEFLSDNQVYEVDVRGLSTRPLNGLKFEKIRRPM